LLPLLGELAALGTSACWSLTSTFFTLAGRQVGSVAVNRVRLLFAVLFLTASHALLGLALPVLAEPWRWLWLGLSGIVGLVIGDALLFQAFVWIGPRLTMLMMSLAPVISAALAWLFLGEVLAARELLAVMITVAGVAFVVLDRPASAGNRQAERDHVKGILFGLGAAAGQALGLILAKKGLAGDFSPLSGTLMRMVIAAAIMWGLAAAQGQAAATLRRVRGEPLALRRILGGAFFGPFLGVTLSLVAVQATQVGIASALMALPPVFLLPISRLVFGERVGARAIAGTFVAIAGVAMLTLL
jgi:drug/metabolite transporter (DMT)-like permease